MKYADTLVTFSEIPDEITLCINISGCPHRCPGCHSPWLWEDTGEELTEEVLKNLIERNSGISCICFMGGDNDIPTLHSLAEYVIKHYSLRVAWYSGLTAKPVMDRPTSKVFDYIKVGPYIEHLGPLTSRDTNQRLYAKGKVLHKMDMSPNMFYDITDKFWKEDLP